MKLLNLIFHNLKRMMKNKLTLALTFVLPTVVIFGMGLLVKGPSESTRSYYLVNSDRGSYGKEFAEELSKSFNIKLLQRDKAMESLKKKTIGEFYELDASFSETLSKGQRPQLVANRREPLQGYSDFEIKSGELLDRLVFSALVEKASGTKLDLEEINNDKVEIKSSTEKKTDMGRQLVVNFLISFNLFCAIGMCYELFALRSERTLRRSLSTANSPRTVIGAVLGAQFIVVSLGYAVLTLAYSLINDKALLPQAPLIIVNLIMTTAVALSLAVFVARLLKNEKLIPVVMQIILVGSCFIGGSFMPYELLPKGITFLSKFTPQYWAIQSINEGRYEFSLIVLLFAVVLFTAGTVSTRSFAEV